MDTWFVATLIAAGALSAAGPIVWASAILQSSLDICENGGADAGGEPAQGGTRCLDASLAQLDRLVRSSCKPCGDGSTARKLFVAVTPYKQLRIQNMFMEIDRRMRGLDAATRQPYETRIAELTNLASCAGIHWSPTAH